MKLALTYMLIWSTRCWRSSVCKLNLNCRHNKHLTTRLPLCTRNWCSNLTFRYAADKWPPVLHNLLEPVLCCVCICIGQELAKGADLQATLHFLTLTDLMELPSLLAAWFPRASERHSSLSTLSRGVTLSMICQQDEAALLLACLTLFG